MNENKIGVPGAIIIAGLLIAGAVVFAFSDKTAAPAKQEPVATGATLGQEFYLSEAEKFDLNIDEFNECLVSDETLALIQEDFDEAVSLIGERVGTPATVFVAPNGMVMLVSGVQPEANLNTIAQAIRDENYEGFIEAPEGFRTTFENDHVLGDPNVPITLIEYSDYQCPFCGQYHPAVKSFTENNPDVKWVYRHLPLASIHPQAVPAAAASECIAAQKGNDAFWQFTDDVFSL